MFTTYILENASKQIIKSPTITPSCKFYHEALDQIDNVTSTQRRFLCPAVLVKTRVGTSPTWYFIRGTWGILSLTGSHDTLISYLDNLHFVILCK